MAEIYKWCMGCFSHSLVWVENNGTHSGLIQYNMYFPIGSVEPKLHPPYKSWRMQRNPGSGDIALVLQSLGLPLAILLIQVVSWRRNISSSAHDYWCPVKNCSVRTLPVQTLFYSDTWRHRAILQSFQIWGLSAFLLNTHPSLHAYQYNRDTWTTAEVWVGESLQFYLGKKLLPLPLLTPPWSALKRQEILALPIMIHRGDKRPSSSGRPSSTSDGTLDLV